ncbi:hypothetical protein BLNAU_8681 [Blattamonas nauphoetae]|uniref:Uncharacterized protein n=1 Tax=Blattamonas nauphoetae TaxID=2049346 RepID=A0ABQ9XXX8_9EUKA|nr:hypothetical protein BLNAU_8681 [Blattamonas nauphoetae]
MARLHFPQLFISITSHTGPIRSFTPAFRLLFGTMCLNPELQSEIISIISHSFFDPSLQHSVKSAFVPTVTVDKADEIVNDCQEAGPSIDPENLRIRIELLTISDSTPPVREISGDTKMEEMNAQADVKRGRRTTWTNAIRTKVAKLVREFYALLFLGSGAHNERI